MYYYFPNQAISKLGVGSQIVGAKAIERFGKKVFANKISDQIRVTWEAHKSSASVANETDKESEDEDDLPLSRFLPNVQVESNRNYSQGEKKLGFHIII